jgi:type VI secretion system secreted protein VgrG
VTTSEFTFSWEGADASAGAWKHLEIAQVRGVEELSTPFRVELIVLARDSALEVQPDEIVRSRATLRLATKTEPPYRVVHGIVTEAEELGVVDGGGMAYRLVLSPPLVRAQHRVKSRIFLEKTTRQIIDTVLEGDPDLVRDDGVVPEPDNGDTTRYEAARERYAWRLSDTSRVDQVATRPYCVQYCESDLAFLSRLLEAEGIAYHYEHGEGVCLLVLSDKDAGRPRLAPFAPLGPGITGREVASMKLGARLRARKVSILDYNWRKPALDMGVQQAHAEGAADLVAYAYPGGYPDAPEQGEPLARAMLERLEIEASYAVGEGACRVLSAGTIFALEHPKARYEGEYLVTRIELRGEQQGVLPPGFGGLPALGAPFAATFECARRGKEGAAAESRYRPARLTPRPRIQGTQTGFVTAEPGATGAEINVGGPPGGEIGCVRVKFHWDRDAERHAKEPTSCWIRVNQVFAGVGEGGVFHPRVGVEVIVDFEEGDPDRPIVVGRVYNGQNLPPTTSPTVSTFKTMTSPGDGTYNELTLDDTAGSQQIKLHTPKDWNSEVGNDRSERVANNSGSSVGVDRSEVTGSNRSTMVGADNAELIGANETLTVGANQTHTIGANQVLSVLGNRNASVLGDEGVAVTGNQTTSVTGDRGMSITGNEARHVTGAQSVTVTGAHSGTYKASHAIDVTSDHSIKVGGAQALQARSQKLSADGDQLLESKAFTANASASADVVTKVLGLVGSGKVSVSGGEIVIKGAPVTVEGGEVTVNGGTVIVNGSSVTVNGGGSVSMTAGVIKMNS